MSGVGEREWESEGGSYLHYYKVMCEFPLVECEMQCRRLGHVYSLPPHGIQVKSHSHTFPHLIDINCLSAAWNPILHAWELCGPTKPHCPQWTVSEWLTDFTGGDSFSQILGYRFKSRAKSLKKHKFKIIFIFIFLWFQELCCCLWVGKYFYPKIAFLLMML